ncbi:MAG TPA: tetratricopeptide repeat protein [bacterium]|nr:tetratricopeptide repeat protein [bacterium]
MRAFSTLVFGFSTLVLVSVPAFSQPLPSEKARSDRIARLQEIVKANSKDVGTWHDLAGVYREAKDWDKAIAAETRAIEGHPKYAVAYYGRGVAYFYKQNFPAARADFTKAIDLWQANGGLERFLTLEQPKPEHIDSYRMRGLAWSHEGKYAEGIADCDTALKLKKDDAPLTFEKAYLEQKAGKTKEAVADYRRAGLLFVDRGSSRDALLMAKALEDLGAKPESEEILKRLEEAKPKSDLP